MFEKLLLTFTITFSLSLFIGFGTQSSTQEALSTSGGDLPQIATVPEQALSAHE
jgi:hypothetical protein